MNKQDRNAPAGDGWAALGRVRDWSLFQLDQCQHADNRDKDRHNKYWLGCCIAFKQSIEAIDRELASLPAATALTGGGSTQAEAGSSSAVSTSSDVKDVEVDARKESDAMRDEVEAMRTGINYAFGALHMAGIDIANKKLQTCVRELAARGAKDLDHMRDRAEKAESEVNRLRAIVEKIKEATK